MGVRLPILPGKVADSWVVLANLYALLAETCVVCMQFLVSSYRVKIGKHCFCAPLVRVNSWKRGNGSMWCWRIRGKRLGQRKCAHVGPLEGGRGHASDRPNSAGKADGGGTERLRDGSVRCGGWLVIWGDVGSVRGDLPRRGVGTAGDPRVGNPRAQRGEGWWWVGLGWSGRLVEGGEPVLC